MSHGRTINDFLFSELPLLEIHEHLQQNHALHGENSEHAQWWKQILYGRYGKSLYFIKTYLESLKNVFYALTNNVLSTVEKNNLKTYLKVYITKPVVIEVMNSIYINIAYWHLT